MKKNITIIFLALACISAAGISFGGELKSRLAAYNRALPQEKMYVQTDKTFYKPTESIWYKVFLVDANNHRTSVVSDVAYVELFDAKGNVVQRHEHFIGSGTDCGKFELTNVTGGIYTLKAYTRWQQNFGSEAIFTKELTVQKQIFPRLLLKLDFEKRAYGAGDEVLATLKVTDLQNHPTDASTLKTTVRIAGSVFTEFLEKTKRGEAKIRFRLPADLRTTDGILQIVVQDKGVEESITRSVPIVLNSIDLHFYPEGGDMAVGVPCRVAFEALNEFGKGADVAGEIRDENGVFITKFESFHLGMGALKFTPQTDKTYFAHLTKPEGKYPPVALPKAKTDAFVLNMNKLSDKNIEWTIYSPENASITLVGQTQGEIYLTKNISLKKGKNTVETSNDAFPAGIVVFTLFDDNGQERAERLVFLNENKKLNIEIETKENYEQGEQAKIRVKTTDEKGTPVSAKIGLAVVDEQLLTLADDKQDNMLTYLLLSSELKGKIQEPSFYFDKDEKKSAKAIDYLLLTHGWRRFKWEEIQNFKPKKQEFLAEKITDIYGYVLDKNGKPAQADVFLLHISSGSAGVMGKVRTTTDGQFVFHNLNPNYDVYITTELPNQVYLFKGKPVILETRQTKNDNSEGIVGQEDEEKEATNETANAVQSLRPIPIVEYVGGGEALMEVVAVGYGTQKKSELTGSITSVATRDVIENQIAHVLEGRVAGVSVEDAIGTPGSEPNIRIRGTGTLSNNEKPLVIINGVVSDMNMVNPQNISNMTILKDILATAIYGSRAANGVIIIETKTRFEGRKIEQKPNYGGVYLKKNNNREFYKAQNFVEKDDNYNHTNSTVYWNGNVTTDENGVAEISFKNNLQSSVFRVTAEGFSPKSGLVGAAKKRIYTFKPLSVDMKLPLFVAVGDTVKVPVMIKNTTKDTLNVNLMLELDSVNFYFAGFQKFAFWYKLIKIAPQQTETQYIPIISKSKGTATLKVKVDCDKFSDQISQTFTAQYAAFPYTDSFSGKDAGQTVKFNLPAHVSGSVKAELTCYSDFVDELFDGVEGIFREPYGCFEQVSSSTFPNIFALQLLQFYGKSNPEVREKALKYIENGYKKLANYEVKGGGFEWYGGSPAHEVLSAYGILEFYEMSKIYDKVDKKLIDRALKFILSRKDSKGGFKQNNGKYGFSGAPSNVNNAYIVYALTETGYNQQVMKEYNATLKEALQSKDMYRMALMANAAYKISDKENYTKLTAHFVDFIKKSDFEKMKTEATIVRSYGNAQYLETTAFWLMALLKDKNNLDYTLIDKCLQFIQSKRNNGRFGNSQSTAVCLQALTQYAQLQNSNFDKSNVQICLNGDCHKIPSIGKLKIDFAEKLETGDNTLEISYKDIQAEFLPYAVNIGWYALLPPSDSRCPLELMAKLAQTKLKVNETVRLSVTLKNRENAGKPMSVAIIGIPGGLSVQHWQLKELQEKEVFDFYEIIDDRLIIYYRELAPNALKTINLDLKADVAGTYTGRASSAYLYYSDEWKTWAKGLNIRILE